MKNNKSNKIVSVLNFLASFCFYICAIINFTNDDGFGTCGNASLQLSFKKS